METDLKEYQRLRQYADLYEDAMNARIAFGNRIVSGLDPQHFDAAIGHYKAVEEEMKRMMGRQLRKTISPGIKAWQQEATGVGEHLLARLLGYVGHPQIAVQHYWEGEGKDNRKLMIEDPRPRLVSELWAYCGHGDPARRRRKGMDKDDATSCGSPVVKSIVYLMAEGCLKAGVRSACESGEIFTPSEDSKICAACEQPKDEHSRVGITPYGELYLKRKADTEDREWTNMHRYLDALRIVGKNILKDLWISAGDQEKNDTHTSVVSG